MRDFWERYHCQPGARVVVHALVPTLFGGVYHDPQLPKMENAEKEKAKQYGEMCQSCYARLVPESLIRYCTRVMQHKCRDDIAQLTLGQALICEACDKQHAEMVQVSGTWRRV